MSAHAAWWRRGGPLLWSGTMLLLALAIANVWSVQSGPSPDRQALRFEPPHSTIMRWLLWSSTTTDEVCVAMVGIVDGDCSPSVATPFVAAMPPVARAGRPYRYQPALTQTVREWTLSGQPPELTIDAVTGLISGRPMRSDRYEVTLTARLTADSVVKRSLSLFVDDRFLLLGADRFGDDIFRNLLRSARYVLLPGLVTVCVGVIGGVLVGAFAGYYGGLLRRALGAATSALQSIPGLLLVFVAASASDLNRWWVMVVVGLILAPETAMGVMERVEAFRRRDFVDAARELGFRNRTILWNEIVWHNTRDFVLNRVTNGFVFAMLMDVTLSYVGLLDAQTVSLGGMLRSGRGSLVAGDSSGEAAAALFGVLFTVTTFTLLDRGIRRAWARSR